MKKIALIPARGGSKRFPKKNTVLFNEIPLLIYSIRFALYTSFFDKIIVSTDDDAIAEIATKYGAEVIKRPSAISGDLSLTKETVFHCASFLSLSDDDWIFTLQPTNPLRPMELIDSVKAIHAAYPKAKSFLSVSLLNRKMGKIEDGLYKPINYRFGQRSQDMELTYFENGLLYGTQVSWVNETKEMLEPEPVALITDPIYSMVDIDDREDLEIAEVIFRQKKKMFEYLTNETKYYNPGTKNRV